jgi:hypothetical protein
MVMSVEPVKVQRWKLYSVDEASQIMGISDQCLRLWIRMKLIHAEKIGHVYVLQGEQLALGSKRYHDNYYADVPVGRTGRVNFVEIE